MPLFNPLCTHIVNATPEDKPVLRRSLWWAVAAAFVLGIVWGRYGSMLP